MASIITGSLAGRILLQSKNLKASVVPKRFTDLSAWVYRSEPKAPPKFHYIAAKSLNAFAWWWMLTHCWYDFGHLVGEFPYPDPKEWTNEELGVALPED